MRNYLLASSLMPRVGVSLQYLSIVILAVFNIIFCLILPDSYKFLSTFVYCIFTTFILLYNGKANLKPLQAWCIGFMLLIAPEGIFDFASISLNFGKDNYSVASSFICLGFTGISLLAAAMNLFPIVNRNQLNKAEIPSRATFVLLIIMYTAYVISGFQAAYITFSMGRAEVLEASFNRSTFQALVDSISTISGLTLPAALAFFLLRFSRLGAFKSILYLSILLSPILLIQFFSGIRSYILSTIISVAFIYFTFRPLKVKQVPALVLMLTFILFVTNLMKNSRLGGKEALENANLGLSIEDFYEGTVRYLTYMVKYFDTEGYRNGVEHLTLFLFWVPRGIWPDKPQQLENWFHQVVQPQHFPYFHSVAATFGATGYADFGFFGGILVIVLIQGLLLGAAERSVNKYLGSKNGAINYDVVFYASTLGLILYSVRQFNSVPSGLTLILLSYLLIKFTLKQEDG